MPTSTAELFSRWSWWLSTAHKPSAHLITAKLLQTVSVLEQAFKGCKNSLCHRPPGLGNSALTL